MIIDLDAHQVSKNNLNYLLFFKSYAFLKGNGYERDFIGNSKVFIFDVFNKNIYPKDVYAESAISRAVKLDYFVHDYEYLTSVDR